MAKRRMGQSGSGGRFRALGESGRANAEERLSEQKTEMLQQRAVQESEKKNDKVEIPKEQADAFQNLANMMVSEASNMKEAKKVADELAKAVQNPDKETGEIKVGDYTVSKDGDIKQSVKKHITSYMYTGILTEDRPVSPPPTSSYAFPLPGTVDVTPPKQADDTPPGEGGGGFTGVMLAGKFWTVIDSDPDADEGIPPRKDGDTHLLIDLFALNVKYGVKSSLWHVESIPISALSGLIVIPLVPHYAEPL
jgi:hypothetical protein